MFKGKSVLKDIPLTRRASLAVLLAAAIWGLYWMPLRYLGARGMDASLIIVLLNLPAGAVAIVWAMRGWGQIRPHLASAALIGASAGLALSLFGLAIEATTVARATLFFYLMPVWGTLIGIWWLGERAALPRWLALVLGLAGLGALLIGGPPGGLGWGDGLGLVSGIVFSLSAASIKRLGQVPLAAVMAAQCVFSALFALALGIIFGGLFETRLEGQYLLILVPMAASLILILPAFVLLFWASQHLYPGRVGLLLMAEVVVALVTSALLLPQEALGGIEWLAVALIIGASAVELLPLGSARKASHPSP